MATKKGCKYPTTPTTCAASEDSIVLAQSLDEDLSDEDAENVSSDYYLAVEMSNRPEVNVFAACGWQRAEEV